MPPAENLSAFSEGDATGSSAEWPAQLLPVARRDGLVVQPDQMGIDMAKAEVKNGKNPQMRLSPAMPTNRPQPRPI